MHTIENLKVVFYWDADCDRDMCYRVELYWEGQLIFKKQFIPQVKRDSNKLLIHNLLKDCYRAHWN